MPVSVANFAGMYNGRETGLIDVRLNKGQMINILTWRGLSEQIS